jgi:protein gp37
VRGGLAVPAAEGLFHARVPAAFVRQVFDVMTDTPQHTYRVLTKRSDTCARQDLNLRPTD